MSHVHFSSITENNAVTCHYQMSDSPSEYWPSGIPEQIPVGRCIIGPVGRQKVHKLVFLLTGPLCVPVIKACAFPGLGTLANIFLILRVTRIPTVKVYRCCIHTSHWICGSTLSVKGLTQVVEQGQSSLGLIVGSNSDSLLVKVVKELKKTILSFRSLRVSI